MNSEQKTDKRSILNFLLFFICYLFLGCNNPVEPMKDTGTAEPGYGTVIIQFQGRESRTTFPGMSFTYYKYTFTKTDVQPQETTEETTDKKEFRLKTGEWYVQVEAYVGEDTDAKLGAEGETVFNVEFNTTKEIRIGLVENATSIEPGTFKYTIGYPTGATVVQITMTNLLGMTELPPPLSLDNNGVTQTMNNIPYGFYLLNIQLVNAYGLYAGISEVIHIYPIQITEYNRTFVEGDFSGGRVWVSKNGGTDIPFNNLKDALDWIEINTAGSYMVKIGADQSLAPYTLTANDGKRDITLIPVHNPAIAVELTDKGSLFTVNSDITLTLGGGVTLQGRNDNDASLIQVKAGSDLIMKTGSVITGNTVTGSGGGVNVASGGTFTMTGGEIYKNTGSGVYTYGTFIMEDGKIYENYGGGVDAFGIFTMTGGEIFENTNSGVRVDAGTFTMSGGKISNNKTGTYGGGVYVYNDGRFTMEGGEISGNKADYSGGGVRVREGTFTMSGGKISGNEANNGGGVYMDEISEFTMSGGEISRNTDGGVFILGKFTMSGGEISGNIGRGVYVSGIFIKTGGTIYGYTNGDEKSNVVRDSSGTVQNNQGHAVYAVSRSSSIVIKRKETTSGPTDNLAFDGRGNPVWSGDWN